ncbi:uncharacterized protein LOC126741401 [Anthonomus grandis grandis]|uniref:uncharacterized protein LOC126741401 n=1 Tax=Anthonomus grandis grandis TaxID=2921223 RepID=UPI002164F0B6|nr:uncharacterized protein LOC126741401 [Anthonomus grandis grandis]XP_050303754.1 uncharacterized protein LOC126741401 [Anthonomus grandis grandis]XP_050303756.1 uncharacterized protein LOC126741401 [Anthonomus grandis grandis]
MTTPKSINLKMSGNGHFLCNIIGCKNSDLKTVESTPLFRVPKDKRARLWKQVLNGYIGDAVAHKAYVCKEHFKPEDFYDEHKLKKTAVPDVSCGKSTEDKDGSNKEKDSIESSRETLKNLKVIRKVLEGEYNQLQEQETLLNKTIESLKEKIANPNPDIPKIPENHTELLRKCFSAAQIDLFTNRTESPKWDQNDFALAYVVYSMTSSEVYNHLRDHVRYPLPKLAEVFRYLREHRAKSKEAKSTEDEPEVETIEIYTEEEEMETCDVAESDPEIETIQILGDDDDEEEELIH